MPNGKFSSFMNERTLEFALVPVIQRALERDFGSVVPIYFWKSREGNSQSLRVHGDRFVRVLALFGRRPKTRGTGTVVAGKINHRLLEFGERARQMGVSTLAGFCPAATLFDLAENPMMFWIPLGEINEIDRSEDLLFHQVSTVEGNKLVDMHGRPLKTARTADISSTVRQASKIMSFAESVEAMSELRWTLESDGPGRNWFGSSYKPVYFLISVN